MSTATSVLIICSRYSFRDLCWCKVYWHWSLHPRQPEKPSPMCSLRPQLHRIPPRHRRRPSLRIRRDNIRQLVPVERKFLQFRHANSGGKDRGLLNTIECTKNKKMTEKLMDIKETTIFLNFFSVLPCCYSSLIIFWKRVPSRPSSPSVGAWKVDGVIFLSRPNWKSTHPPPRYLSEDLPHSLIVYWTRRFVVSNILGAAKLFPFGVISVFFCT